jgi:hypothetical protein
VYVIEFQTTAHVAAAPTARREIALLTFFYETEVAVRSPTSNHKVAGVTWRVDRVPYRGTVLRDGVELKEIEFQLNSFLKPKSDHL